MKDFIFSALIALVFFLIFALLFMGCARIHYGDFSYTRIGAQSIEAVLQSPDGTIMVLLQESNAEVLKEALKLLNKVSIK